jgi:PHS family inorganic phosphate transporter-like MFS transporter
VWIVANAPPLPKKISPDFIPQGCTNPKVSRLDFAFYGLGINNPRQIAHIWLSHSPGNGTQVDDWQTTNPDSNIYDVLKSDAVQYIYTVSIGSVVGSLLLIKFIDYFPRKALFIVCFMLLAGLFFLVGGTLFAVEYTNQHALTITLYALCQLFFNLGPNALTFIVCIFIFHLFSSLLFILTAIVSSLALFLFSKVF